MTDHPGFRLEAIPKPPEPLSAGAVQEWEALAPLVFELRTCRPADLRLLALLCELLSNCRSLETAIRRDGVTVAAGSGGRKGHPALSSLAAARRHAEQLLARFGLVPGKYRADKYSESRAKHQFG